MLVWTVNWREKRWFFVLCIVSFVQIECNITTSMKGDDSMAGSTTNISIRMDSDLKAQADALFNELGMNISTAFNIFVRSRFGRAGYLLKFLSISPTRRPLLPCWRRKGLQKTCLRKAIPIWMNCLLTLKNDRDKVYRQAHYAVQIWKIISER